jgi:hypothetical protein
MSEYEKAKKKEDHIRDAWWKCPLCGQSVPTVNKDIHLKCNHPSYQSLSMGLSKETYDFIHNIKKKKKSLVKEVKS